MGAPPTTQQGLKTHKIHIKTHHKRIKYIAKNNKSLILLFKELSKVKSFGNYDLVIDFQGLIKTAIISKLINAKEIVGFDWNSVREGVASLSYSKKVKILDVIIVLDLFVEDV